MLSADVWPGLVSAYGALVGVAPSVDIVTPRVGNGDPLPSVALKGLAEGEQPSIPESPYAWLMNARATLPSEIGSDLSETKMLFNLRLLADYTNDPVNCERILMPIIEQVRRVHQLHLKLQTTTVVLSKVSAWDWGYTPVNGIWYRSCDLQIEVNEKEIRNFQA